MKRLCALPLLFTAIVLTIVLTVACSSDDNNESTTTSGNSNANPAPYTSLEFPRVKGGNSSVVTHSTINLGTTYSLEWDHQLKSQRWTCFYFNNKNNKKGWNRSNWRNGVNWDNKYWTGDPFQKDPDVPSSEQPNVTGEFSGSSFPDKGFSYFQRGHICASEDRIVSMYDNGQTFYMTNMMPQGDQFNDKIWSKMESFVRNDWGRKISGSSDTLFVVKGGTIDRENQILCRTRSGFIVPRYFFMALLLKRNDSYQAMAFWVEHINSDHSNDMLNNYVINIKELEKNTGIDFFCNLPDNIESSVENQDVATIKRLWNLTYK